MANPDPQERIPAGINGSVADPQLMHGVANSAMKQYSTWLAGFGVASLLLCLLFLVVAFKIAAPVSLVVWAALFAAITWWRRRNVALLGRTSGITALWGMTMISFIVLVVAVGGIWTGLGSWWWWVWGAVLLLPCLGAALAVRKNLGIEVSDPPGAVH